MVLLCQSSHLRDLTWSTMSIVGLCCCSLCGEDVLDFELVILGPFEVLEPYEIEKDLWVERFSIQDVYFDVIANEPYEAPYACQSVGVEDENDCCGGVSNNQICCPVLLTLGLCPPCFETDCGCPSCENTGKTACDGV